MKIVVYYEQMGYGGVDTHLAHLINNWPKKDDRFTVISNPNNDGLKFLKQKITSNSANIITLDGVFKNQDPKSLKLIKVLNSFIVQFRFIIKFKRLLKELSPDVLLSNNGGYPGGITNWWASIIAKKQKSTKNNTFLLVHHAPIKKVVTPVAIFSDLLVRVIVYLDIPVITVSQASKRLLESFTSLQNLNVIYNGLELINKINNPYDIRGAWGIKKNKKIVGIIGPIVPHKGHTTILKVFRQSDYLKQKAQFVIVGTGNKLLLDDLNRKVQEYGLDSIVTFTGFLSEESSQIINSFDLLVMPTIDFEGFGYSMVEAMSIEVPVVASKVGAIPEVIVDGKSGLLVDPQDISGWKNTLEKLIENDALCREIGAAGRERIEKNFTAEKMSKSYYNIMIKQ